MKRFLMMGAALALVVGSSGCIDLNEKLVSQLGNSYVGTGPGLTAAVNAVYMRLRGYYGTEPQQVLNDMGTDEFSNGDQVVGGGAQGWEFYNSYNSAFTSADGRLAGVWNNEYILIALANTVLDDGSKAPVGSDLTQATKDMRIAEAKFLRAMAYFDLVRQWGPVTLNLHSISVTGQLSTEATRAPEDSVYAAILSDLDAAVAGLPVTQSDYGRATKGAALFLRSKVYLTRAYRPWNTANKQADFQKALADIKQILPAPAGSGVGSYSLVADPLSLWPGVPAQRVWSNSLNMYGRGRVRRNGRPLFRSRVIPTPTLVLASYCSRYTRWS